ncbi:hypothetical protein ACQJBY_038183 [Aegilops geniculata]
MGSRLLPCSHLPAAAPPLEDDNLLSEILLRLPPEPSSLPRSSVVSKRWRRLISDPGFSRRFCLHHRRKPPLLGFFEELCFKSTMDCPNRIPDDRFCLQVDNHFLLGCHHGLVLIFQSRPLQVLVWDPITGELHHIAAPPGFDPLENPTNGAVLRATGDIQHFQVVLVCTETNNQQHTLAIARVYSSETGGWGDLISTLIPPKASPGSDRPPCIAFTGPPGVQVGHSLYWLLFESLAGILEFDLDRQSLSVIHVPVGIDNYHFTVMRAEGGGLGFIYLSGLSAQLWRRKTNCDGVATWVLGKTVELDKLFSMNSKDIGYPMVQGFAEDNNVVFLLTDMGLFTIQLESLQFKKLCEIDYLSRYYPLESVFAAGNNMPLHYGYNKAHISFVNWLSQCCSNRFV